MQQPREKEAEKDHKYCCRVEKAGDGQAKPIYDDKDWLLISTTNQSGMLQNDVQSRSADLKKKILF